MTDEELVGQLMRAIAELKAEVARGRERTYERLTAIEGRVARVEEGQQTLRDAADKAFEEAMRVNKLVRGLSCMEEPTSPDLSDCLPDKQRPTLSSMDDREENSALREAIEAQRDIAIKALDRGHSQSAQLSFGNWTLKGSALLTALASVGALVVWALISGHLKLH